jgi:hypothetical protein
VTIPMRCPVCYRQPAGYYGRVVWPEELAPDKPQPICPNHDVAYAHQLVTIPAKIVAPVPFR